MDHEGCDHTEEEHQEQMLSVMKEITNGNFAPLVPQASNEGLIEVLQAAAVEIFIRAESMDDARSVWENIDKLVRDTFRGDTAELSRHPEEFKKVMEVRDMFQQRVESTQFVEEATDELNQIIDQHGVLDDDPPSTGFYL